jgi:predicted RNA-binding protein with PUA-like domain
MAAEKRYWLMKSEPETYGIDHLQQDQKTAWTGIRNFQARNYMRDDMHIGDPVLFYHSSCNVPGVYGLAQVASAPYPDPTQFDPASDYYEPRASLQKLVWALVDIVFVKKLAQPITLSDIRTEPELQAMAILQPGSRLSITPVSAKQYEHIVDLAA